MARVRMLFTRSSGNSGWHLRLSSNYMVMTSKLAHGHAHFSKYPPMKVLLLTLQNAPPGVDYERDKKFSKLKICKSISYAAVVAHTNKSGRHKLAAMLVEHEPRSSKRF